MKRFWTEAAAVAGADGFTINLDGKALRLPGMAGLAVPFAPLAQAIAEEWANVPASFSPDDLPLTRLTATAQNRAALPAKTLISALADYGMNDLLCYRAADQPALAALEAASWQPWLDWVESYCGAALRITHGITPFNQPPATRARFATALHAMTAYQLTGLGVIVPALGSLVLGLAMAAGVLGAAQACACAELDALWQAQKWGADPETIQRRQRIAEDVAAAARFMVLCQP